MIFMPDKIVFLDFDGVLNSEKYVRGCKEYGVIIDPARIILLKQLIDATDAKIVLSTAWREHWDQDDKKCDTVGRRINDLFKQYRLHIFDKIPSLGCCREDEIAAWLRNHTPVKNFVVLDDRFLSSPLLLGHFIKTSNYRNGLEEADVKKSIEILENRM